MEGMTKSSVGSWTRKRAFVGSPQKKNQDAPAGFSVPAKELRPCELLALGRGGGGTGRGRGSGRVGISVPSLHAPYKSKTIAKQNI